MHRRHYGCFASTSELRVHHKSDGLGHLFHWAHKFPLVAIKVLAEVRHQVMALTQEDKLGLKLFGNHAENKE